MTYLENDYGLLERRVEEYGANGTFHSQNWQKQVPLSVLVSVYNQEEQLRKMLLALMQQTYSPENFEVVIIDDGSRKETSLSYVARQNFPFNIKYIWQPDLGFRVAKARNEGLKRAQHETIICLDADMIPEHVYLEEVMKRHYAAKQLRVHLVTIQDRAFVDPEELGEKQISSRKLFEVPQMVSRRFGTREDWKRERYARTDTLKKIPAEVNDPAYYIGSLLSGGNCSFSKADAFEAGLFDESFHNYRAEDTEFGVRLYKHFNLKLGHKLFFVPVRTLAYHLDHGGPVDHAKQQESRGLLREKIKEARQRRVDPLPEVSVYILCYNQERFIERALESVSRQKFDLSQLEVVVGEDGSTDRTKMILERLVQEYVGRLNIRVIGDEKNRGIAENTNHAIRACRGKYILQLDGDDELFPEAVSMLYEVLEKKPEISVAFGDSIDLDHHTGERAPHWSCPEFTQEWHNKCTENPKEMAVEALRRGMRIHHPRMFRREAFYRTEGVNPSLESSVDYDLYLKLTEQGLPWHIKHPLYLYRVNHGANISLARNLQKVNGAFIQELSKMRTSAEPRKEAYFLDEAEGVHYFNFTRLWLRMELLVENWNREKKPEGTKLHQALIREFRKLDTFDITRYEAVDLAAY